MSTPYVTPPRFIIVTRYVNTTQEFLIVDTHVPEGYKYPMALTTCYTEDVAEMICRHCNEGEPDGS